MKICSDIILEKWTPDFSSSGQASPNWTRSRYKQAELFNALEWIVWTQNPVQVVLCEECGQKGCATGGFVHVSRLDDFVLWTRPQIEVKDAWEVAQYNVADPLKRFGAIAVPKQTWNEWRIVASLPEFGALTPANGEAIFDAWFLAPARSRRIDELVPFLNSELLACDSLEPTDAIERITRWVDRLKDTSASLVNASLHSPTTLGVRIETFYFDGFADEDWPALAISGEADYLLLNQNHALVLPLPDA